MSNREELQRELEQRDEEILRLRDLLLAQERELGEALGRLREQEDLMRNLLWFAARVPGGLRVAAAGFRRLRPRRGRSGD